MEITIPGYRLDTKLHHGPGALVYRGVRLADDRCVVLKILPREYPNPQELSYFRYEYQVLRSLDIKGVIKAYTLEKYGHSYAMVLEDFVGESLAGLQEKGARKFSVAEFLPIALSIVAVLASLHEHGVSHRNINPHNVLWDPRTSDVRLIDFANASNSTLENQECPWEDLEHAYISPEQTGMMNRGIDYRTDFYSLGVMFYQMLSGHLPFEAQGKLELLHAHIAENPKSLHHIEPDIPEVLSAIVYKSMAKMAEERYQSAAGLRIDLKKCLDLLWEKGSIPTFAIGINDVSSVFCLPQKLYGRDAEIQRLLLGYDFVARGGSKVTIVSGAPGVGKTSLVYEIEKTVAARHGYFIRGKCDQNGTVRPYGAFAAAIQKWIRYVLSESDEKIAVWRENLQLVLGTHGRMLTDLIPDLEYICGCQPALPELAPTELQKCFQQVCGNFMRILGSPEHPVVLFLDDLHFADGSTLGLLKLLCRDVKLRHVFFIGAYRENVLDATPPLVATLHEIESPGVSIEKIRLEPLPLSDISGWLATALRCDLSLVGHLAELCLRKTGGNPFFLRQFIRSLYQKGVITFEPSLGQWQWDVEKAGETVSTENVGDWLARHLSRMPDTTLRILKIAACLGSRFELAHLANLASQAPQDVLAYLQIPLSEGFISSTGMYCNSRMDMQNLGISFQFQHDQVQQVLYSLWDRNEKLQMHLDIGRYFLKNLSEKEREEKLFELVEHFNSAIPLITEESEKDMLAKLNWKAGIQAKSTNAFPLAQKYLQTGKMLWPANIWQKEYHRAYSLYKNLAEVEYGSGNADSSRRLSEDAISWAQTAMDKAVFYNLLLMQYTANAEYDKAIHIGKEALALLGISLAQCDAAHTSDEEVALVWENLKNREILSLRDALLMESEEKRMAMRLLQSLDGPAYYADQQLFMLIAAKKVNLSLVYGNVPESCGGYYCFGLMVGPTLGDYKTGYAFGELAVRLAEKFRDSAQKCKSSNMFANFLMPWVRHIRETQSVNENGYLAGLACCEFEFAGYILGHQVVNDIFAGESLHMVARKIEKSLLFTQTHHNQIQIDAFLGHKMVVANLQGQGTEPVSFALEGLSEEQYLQDCRRHKTFLALFQYLVLKAQALYLHGQYAEALESLQEATRLPAYPFGMVICAEHNFYHSLVLLSLYESAQEKQKLYWEQLEHNQNQMKSWAESCPQNFAHRYLLIEAGKAFLTGEYLPALELYDKAIESAWQNDSIYHEALANELAARCYLGKGKKKMAETYMKDALYGYARWGGTAKLKALEQECSWFNGVSELIQEFTGRTSEKRYWKWELAPILKISQTVSAATTQLKTLENLLVIASQASGAHKVALIEEKDAKLFQKAYYCSSGEPRFMAQFLPLSDADNLATTFVYYVYRTQREFVVDDVEHESMLAKDAYVGREKPKSLLGLPVIHRQKIQAVLYLENKLIPSAFSQRVVELLRLLAAQMALALENAHLSQNLQEQLALHGHIEQQLRESEEKYRLLFEQAVDAVLLVAIDTEKLVDYNNALVEALGYTFEELRNKRIQDIDGLESEENIRRHLQSLFQKDLEVFETRLRNKSGELVDYCVKLKLVKIRGENFALAIARNIAARKKTERRQKDYQHHLQKTVKIRTAELLHANERLRSEMEERLRMEQELLKARTLESLGTLAGGIAHDFNNFLNAIMGNVSLAKEKVQGEVVEILADAEEACARARDLTRQLLTFAKGGLPVKKVSSLAELLKSCVPFTLRGSNVTCSFDLPADLWKSETDESQIGQVIHNLVINSQQAMPKGGNLNIRGENIEIAPADQLPLRPGKYIKISVEDQGIGILPEHLPKIFTPYFSTKGLGNGLGLATVYSIIQKHGGHITVSSQVGVGTAFYIYLPACDKNVALATELSNAPRKGKGRLLMMDDDRNILKATVHMLAYLGYDSEVSANGEETLDKYCKAKNNGVPYDVVLLDLTIVGGMGGKETIARLLLIDPQVKAIVSSGYSMDPVMAEFRKYGFQGVLVKPYSLRELSEALHALMPDNGVKQ